MLNENQVNELRKDYLNNPNNKVKERMLNNSCLVDLVRDSKTIMNDIFNIEINTHGVVNQYYSGRCWSFAALNVLREKVIDECNLNEMNLSGSYIAFYDKLEKFNYLLERLMIYRQRGKKLYDNNISDILWNGIKDEGYFTRFAHLVDKYGIVPESVFPETYSSAHTNEINDILSRLIQLFYLELERNEMGVRQVFTEYLRKAYVILCNMYSIPPKRFDFEYKNRNGEFIVDKDLTPKEFYKKYINIDLCNEYVEVASYQDEKYSFYKLYEQPNTTIMEERKNYCFLNLPPDEFSELIITQLKAGEPVYFYASMTDERMDGIWIDLMERYGDIFGIDLKMDRNSFLRTNGFRNGHCMLITGAKEIEGKVTRWKIENSWGSRSGKDGYYVATNDWINNYVTQIVINKKYLKEEQLNVLLSKKEKIKKKDLKF